jgi:hypothetical protein
MLSLLLALGLRNVAPGPPDAQAVLVALLAAVASTAAVTWWGNHLEASKRERELEELASAVPVAGIH